MKVLEEGYRNFCNTADRELYASLASGQQPHTLVIGCSDSRIVPEEIFGARPGELFVLRNVGNRCPQEDFGAGCAVTYAVAHLHVRNAIVLSHADCGAVKAASDPEHLHEEALKGWLGDEVCQGACLEESVKDWGIRQLNRLNSMEVVRNALARGELATGLFYFDIATLRLDRYDGTEWSVVEADSGSGEETAQ